MKNAIIFSEFEVSKAHSGLGGSGGGDERETMTEKPFLGNKV